jgi:hypothetical protein
VLVLVNVLDLDLPTVIYDLFQIIIFLYFLIAELKLFLVQQIDEFYIEPYEQNNQLITKKEELTISPEQVWIRLSKRLN